MSAPAICLTLLVFLALGVPVTFLIMRDEKRKRREWRPDGYRPGPSGHAAVVSDWWHRPLPAIGVRQSLVVAGEASPVVMVEEKDPRVMGGRRG